MGRISTTAKRLEELMHFYNINQNDICKKTSIPKSAMSMYISGQRNPRQDRLSDIAEAYNVSETWLMGYDVPMEKSTTLQQCQKKIELNDELESMIIAESRKLNHSGKLKLLNTAKEMTFSPLYNPNYQTELAAAHERTDIEVTEEDRLKDDDIMEDDSEWE